MIDQSVSKLLTGSVTRELYEAGDTKAALSFINGYMQHRFSSRPLRSEEELRKILYAKGPARAYRFMKKCFKDASSFDIANIHFYEPSEYLDDVIQWVKDEMKKNGYQKPIWITELGVKDKFNRISPEQAAEELVKKCVISLAKGVGLMIWFRASESCAPNEASESDEPLFAGGEQEDTLFPAGKAYQVLIERLQGAAYVREIAIGEGIHAFEFESRSGTISVFWSDEEQEITLKTPSDEVVVTDITGKETTYKTTDGSFRLLLTPVPIIALQPLRK